MNKRKKIIILSTLGVLIVLCLVLTITKAFMKPLTDVGNLTEVSLNSCAKIQLTSESSIDLENTYPMSRNRGLQTTPYTFTVTSYCETYIGFNLYFSSVTSNTLDDSSIHYILTYKNSDDVLVEGILSESTDGSSDFSDSELVELDTGLKTTHKNIYNLFRDTIGYKSSKEYNLYLFIDESVTSSTLENETFIGGVSVKAYDNNIDTTSSSNLTINLKHEDTSLTSTTYLYNIASVNENGSINVLDTYSSLNLPTSIDGINSDATLVTTLSDFISSSSISATSTSEVTATSTISKDIGMYLLKVDDIDGGSYLYKFEPTLVSIPVMSNGSWNYDVSVTPNVTKYGLDASESSWKEDYNNNDILVNLGDTLLFNIVLTNNGEVTFTSVTATVTMTADEGEATGVVVLTAGEGYTISGTTAKQILINSFTIGNYYIIQGEYVVFDDDAEKTLTPVINVEATAIDGTTISYSYSLESVDIAPNPDIEA